MPARVTLIAVALSLVTACGGGDGPAEPPGEADPGPGLRLIGPVDGALNELIFYGWLVDDQPGPGFLDYTCGPKGRDGHRGTDILLPSFRDMDAGVPVIAPAAGSVVRARDGLADRNTSLGQGLGRGNFVELEHANGMRSVYMHLRRGSVAVATGDAVTAGDRLGLVGSSGNSNWPHLHFELISGPTAIDPWEGDCGADVSLWADQLPYQNGFRLIDAGLSDLAVPSYAALLERPGDVTTYRTDDARLVFWVTLHNPRAGLARFALRDPDGMLAAEQRVGMQDGPSTFLLFAVFPVRDALERTGDWEAVYSHAGETLATIPFEIVDPPVTAATDRIPGRAAVAPSLHVWEVPAEGTPRQIH